MISNNSPLVGSRRWHLAAMGLLLVGIAAYLHSSFYALSSGGDADVYRQWTVSQYVKQGIDPYNLCLKALRHTYGITYGPDRMRLHDVRMWDLADAQVHPEDVHAVSALGLPVATYPPSATFFLSTWLASLPGNWLTVVWLWINTGLLLLLGLELRRHVNLALPVILAVLLIWRPTHEVIRTSQFCFLVFLCALAGLRLMNRRPWLAGLLFAVALLKPSLSLLFLCLPFVRRKWIALATPFVIHLAGALGLSAWLHTPLRVLLSEWLEIPRYFLQGAYTLQEVFNGFGIENTPAATIAVLVFFAAVLAWCWVHRSAPAEQLIAFLCFANLAWTYHERYDFVLLAFPLLGIVGRLMMGAKEGRTRDIAGSVAFLVLGIAMLDPVYGGITTAARMLRWAGRAAVLLLFAATTWAVRKGGERTQPTSAA